MRHNSFSLAAFAAASVPGFEPVRTVAIPTPQDDVDVAGVIGRDQRKVLVTSPRSTAGGVRLEKELSITGALSQGLLEDLVPAVLGSVKLTEGGRAAVTEVHAGAPLILDSLTRDRALASSLGEVIARIHTIPPRAVETVGAEAYSAQALREAHRTQLARAQKAEPLPVAVVQRWESLLADDALWDYTPVVIHGDLSEESLFHSGSRITGVRGWDTARIGDPADDLAWLAAALDEDTFEALFAAYRAKLTSPAHPRLLERAQAVGEFAVMDWLLHGVEAEDETIIDDARAMLRDLESDISQLAKEEAESAYHSLDRHGSFEAEGEYDASAPSADSAASAGSPTSAGSAASADAPPRSWSPAAGSPSSASAPSSNPSDEEGFDPETSRRERPPESDRY